MRAEVRIEGMAEITRKLLDVKVAVGDALADAGVHGMLVIEGGAREKCPVRTGTLVRSLNTKPIEKTATSATIITGTNVEYGPFVELGTSRMAAQPYLRPSVDENKDRVFEVIREDLDNAIQEAL